MYRHLLVPVESTDACIEALGHATEFAQAIGARITFLHVLPASASRVTSGQPAALARPVPRRVHELLARAEAAARAQGVPCSSAVAVAVAGSVEEGSFETIAKAARQHDCDLICMATGAPGAQALASGTPDAAGLPVLMCATDRRPAVEAAIGFLLGAHRALADELHEWLDLFQAAGSQGSVPGATTLREIAAWLRGRQARRLRPEAETSLFSRLRERTSVVSAELDELERLHRRDEELLDELAQMAGQNPQSGTTAKQLERALSAYALFAWEWMGREQGVILPAARRYLNDADWMEIHLEFDCAATLGRAAKHTDTISEPNGSRA
jgi:nucleotide-binding universal stress UspA family protein